MGNTMQAPEAARRLPGEVAAPSKDKALTLEGLVQRGFKKAKDKALHKAMVGAKSFHVDSSRTLTSFSCPAHMRRKCLVPTRVHSFASLATLLLLLYVFTHSLRPFARVDSILSHTRSPSLASLALAPPARLH